jgi:hypothetical protein
MQEFIVFILFAGAIGYLGRVFYKSVISRKKVGGECSKCSENTIKTERPA